PYGTGQLVRASHHRLELVEGGERGRPPSRGAGWGTASFTSLDQLEAMVARAEPPWSSLAVADSSRRPRIVTAELQLCSTRISVKSAREPCSAAVRRSINLRVP